MSTISIATPLLLGACLILLAGPAFGQAEIIYDEFAQLPREEQVDVFRDLSPKNRALIARTQAERWLVWNRDRLTVKQIALVEEAIEFVQPHLYDDMNREAEQRQLSSLMKRLRTVFDKEQLSEWLGEGASYIPPPPADNEK